ncbi:hypothetical protein RCG23_09645 [Neobacillus sp. PS3-34]|uniref:hypothetical protein n=1 Tax=Neobacillus sp. PS3-34 TaxID=3070678 RepID=UPI0027DF6BC4|nr:hypothetical protein [Neobacillus sp. PS3-34]WML50078.1 hypothetical protein RCG23_09645 [Neobacillus sp. PS3-34]
MAGGGFSFYAVTIIFRAFLGINMGLWVCTVVYGIQAIILISLHRRFLEKHNSFGRVAISILISIFSSITLITILDFLDKPIDSKNLIISFLVLPALGTGLMTHTIENWQKNREIRSSF